MMDNMYIIASYESTYDETHVLVICLKCLLIHLTLNKSIVAFVEEHSY